MLPQTDDVAPSPGPAPGEDTPALRHLIDSIEQKLSSDSFHLPMLPVASAELLGACQREDVDAAWLAARVERDPALSAILLRVVNSVAQGSRESIVSLTQAIARLARRDLRDLVLVATLEAGVFRSRGLEPDLQELWRHSTRVAGWSREIARMRRSSVESAFLAGLLHDIGRAVLLGAAVEVQGASLSRSEWEGLQPLFDARHEEIGGKLARAWQLPDAVAEAVCSHHAKCSESTRSVVSLTVSLADRLSREVEGEPQEEETGRLAAALGIYPDELNQLRECRENIEALAESLA